MPSRAAAEGPGDDALAWTILATRDAPPARLPDIVDAAFGRLGARSATVYLADHDHAILRPFPGDDDREPIAVDGTIGGRAYVAETLTAVTTDGGGTRLWLPLVDGTARLGVLAVDVDGPVDIGGPGSGSAADGPDGELVARFEVLAALVAELVVSKGQYTDVIEQVRRGRPMTLAAELQRCTLPPAALVTPAVAVAGILEPAYEVAGDTFDYALNERELHVSVVDSVGHELRSSLISHLVYGSLRNSRRHGVDLADAYAVADEAVRHTFPDVRFATALYGTLDVDAGRFSWVAAGHPPPVLVRDRHVIVDVDWVPELPIGLGDGRRPTVNEVLLEPGDVLLLYTDGVVEGGAPGSERFGLERLADLLARCLLDDVTPAETLRRLVSAVLEHSAHELRDDAGMVLVEYLGQTAADV